MSKINIPPAALEEGARAIFKVKNPDLEWENCAAQRPRWAQGQRNQARAAFLAIVEAWPGMKTEAIFWSNADGHGCGRHTLFLPLTENPDDKA